MNDDPDDLLPDQVGAAPSAEELASRARKHERRLGRRTRLKSWATILIGLLALLGCLYFFSRTG